MYHHIQIPHEPKIEGAKIEGRATWKQKNNLRKNRRPLSWGCHLHAGEGRLPCHAPPIARSLVALTMRLQAQEVGLSVPAQHLEASRPPPAPPVGGEGDIGWGRLTAPPQPTHVPTRVGWAAHQHHLNHSLWHAPQAGGSPWGRPSSRRTRPPTRPPRGGKWPRAGAPLGGARPGCGAPSPPAEVCI